jgi:glutaredoxin 3
MATAASSSSPVEKVVNAITVAITRSPLHEGKKLLFISRAGKYDEAAIKARLQSIFRDNKVVVFSWTFCPFAKRAKQLLTEMGVKFTAVELDQIEGGPALRAELIKLTNRTSVPNVFVSGECVGGCNEGAHTQYPGLIPLYESGRLQPLLQQAGAL